MSIESIIRRLAVRSPGFEVSGHGKAVLTPAEAGMLLAGAERQAAAIIYARYLDDYRDLDYLKAWLHVQYAGQAAKWGWRVKPSKETEKPFREPLHKLAMLAIADVLGREQLTMRVKAEFFGCALSSWKETWEDRCLWGKREIYNQEIEAERVMNENSRAAA